MRPRLSKESVRYRPAAAPDRRGCWNCVFFEFSSLPRVSVGTCRLVRGSIEADHICDRWQPGTNAGNRTSGLTETGREIDRVLQAVARENPDRGTGRGLNIDF